MRLKFSKQLYPKYALIKSAYNFTDVAYIHIDCDEDYYIVDIRSKKNELPVQEGDFENEMLSQSARYVVFQKTKNIRELITARAMASTLIGEMDPSNDDSEENFDMDDVLKDWFENENT